jgi:hypothetical protein
MAKRTWKVQWHAQPQSDGLERLGQAVKLVIDREVLTRETRTDPNDEEPRLSAHARVGALEELDA